MLPMEFIKAEKFFNRREVACDMSIVCCVYDAPHTSSGDAKYPTVEKKALLESIIG